MKKTRVTKKCSNCGTSIEVKQCRLKEHNYCSVKCSVIYQYKIGQKTGKQMTERAHQVVKEKGQMCYMLPHCGDSPSEPISTKFGRSM